MEPIENTFKPSSKSFKNTFCVFNEIDAELVTVLKPNYESVKGSKYYYTNEGMYRLSNHWGRLANSKWRLVAATIESNSKFKLGFATWDSFYPDNNEDLLYYIEADFEAKTAIYQHKNNPNFNKSFVLRTSLQTSKRIKQIRNLFDLNNWAKYHTKDINELRFLIISELIATNKTLDEIKRSII